MVVGGYGSGGYLDSTETLVEGDSAWTDHQGALPAPFGLAAVLTIDNIPLLFGGQEWDSSGTVLCCTVQYCAVLYCTILTVLYCTVLYCTVL